MANEMRKCHVCGTETNAWCLVCVAAFDTRRPVAEMTVDERIAEMNVLSGPLEIPFDKVHQRIEELMGRPVWTHEMAFWDELLEELRQGQPATMTEIVEKIPADKLIVLEVSADPL
jgi:hypothetical protein